MVDTKITDLGVLCTPCSCDVIAMVDVTCPATTLKITYDNFIGGNKVIGTQDFWIPAGAWYVDPSFCVGADISVTKVCDKYISTINFDTTTSEDAQFLWHPPLNWDYGTVIYQLVWTNTCGLATETIDFDLAAVALTDDDAIGTATFGTAKNVTDTFTAQNDINTTSFSTVITPAGTPVSGDSILFKLSRDTASDNLTGDCKVLGVNIRVNLTAGTST
jgi:pterin-4a-carbinolamine dehydratase